MILWWQHHHRACGFCHAIGLHELASQNVYGTAQQHIAHGRCAVHQQLHAGEISLFDIRNFQHSLNHGGHQKSVGDFVLGDHLDDAGRIDFAQQNRVTTDGHGA